MPCCQDDRGAGRLEPGTRSSGRRACRCLIAAVALVLVGEISCAGVSEANAAEADATAGVVKMTERHSYGEAKVRVTFIVEPADRTRFEAVREATVKMKFLPQACQRVRVRYDAQSQELIEVLTPPGAEVPPPEGYAPTEEIPWNDAGTANWWANGTRRS